jgi:hypothetical protein
MLPASANVSESRGLSPRLAVVSVETPLCSKKHDSAQRVTPFGVELIGLTAALVPAATFTFTFYLLTLTFAQRRRFAARGQYARLRFWSRPSRAGATTGLPDFD